MPGKSNSYTHLSNLELKQLFREQRGQSTSVAPALLEEFNRRGLAVPPPRNEATATPPSPKSKPKRSASWFAFGREGNEAVREELLDAGITADDRQPLQDRAAVVRLVYVWIGYCMWWMRGRWVTFSFQENQDVFRPASDFSLVPLLVPTLLLILITIGLYRQKHWSLGILSFLLGFHGLEDIQQIIALVRGSVPFNLSLYPDSVISLGISISLVVLLLLVMLQRGINRAFGVGPKFIQSYLFIGISIGLLYHAASAILLRSYLN
ncbi:hypothetical protein [Lewinella sp. 4G2]|uniref:hypothetical protein n=1 Tax=Lewinella sp. 4G2 TaxID=1803372 RepID=UPI0007B4A0BA|nr:hypothetical protein [Lewinella sp. 4G2]OAV44867.1 hypothetical protein A3850_010355 [Lewinella sp. 4G2]